MPKFEPWVHWSDRNTVTDANRPGLYILRRFDSAPPTNVDPLEAELLYVGITCDRTLKIRWRDFNRAAFKDKFGHSGGKTFRAKFCVDAASEVRPWLYVAGLPVRLSEPHSSAYIQFVERWILWEHVQRFGNYPICNSK